MKITRTVPILILFGLICLVQAAVQEYVQVRKVDDGDTILLNNNTRVRYIGVNAPEIAHGRSKAEPFADKAFQFNKKQVLNQMVRLEYDQEKTDHYSRALAYVYKKDGTCVNAELLKHGYAYYYPHAGNQKHGAWFLKLQRQAMRARAGIWQDLKKTDKGGRKYLGNVKSKRFHVMSCAFGKKTSRKNRIHFNSKWDAFWQGFAPCKKCR